jgi:hypothetical protein
LNLDQFPFNADPPPKDRAKRRKLLREAVVYVSKGKCEWANCTSRGTDMAHITASGIGGARSRDNLANVAFLCRHHHDCLDFRMSVSQRQYAITEIVRAYVMGNRKKI